MKIALVIVVVIALGIGAAEVALRLFLGFGKPPLYVADPQVGYRLKPNQRTRRFGNLFEINEYSMRGTAIAPKAAPQTLRVLLLGDSIANGGWWTDQSKIVSVQMQRQLQSRQLESYSTVEVLNASANSWGPRNELAYLAKFGTFDAQVIVVLLNTDDLFATAPSSAQVGRDRAYPKQYPPLALVEIIGRLKKAPLNPELAAVQQEGGDRVGANLEAVRQIQRIAQQSNCRLIVAMTPLLREVIPPGPRDYELRARRRVTALMKSERIVYLDLLAAFQTTSDPESLYRDHIHLSPKGYAMVKQMLSDAITMSIDTSSESQTRLPDSLLDDPWR
ncbi:SGNH/GDSL hydrolase family protein [Oscillatoria sp. CS-180]|uniref:SGNH/GDSL hydrolase family protein n=1 Tax=Oscillatoria sp. CS-180 TaxID=3021720 RepID=UPI00232D2A27|nr:SGNH/GDSL hydrolase family protein [Oscillatoria sp. CS-180]MDB9528240.1 SGNH/GDSL hydrolase family protein [Oscillatoria sp. CS-180]